MGTFDYADLNAYLLFVVGLTQLDPKDDERSRKLAEKARMGAEVPLRDIQGIGRAAALVKLPHTASLLQSIEAFGVGVHQVMVVKQDTDEVVGILSQSRLVKFLWENGRSFPVLEQLYPHHLRDLKIGSQEVISIK